MTRRAIAPPRKIPPGPIVETFENAMQVGAIVTYRQQRNRSNGQTRWIVTTAGDVPPVALSGAQAWAFAYALAIGITAGIDYGAGTADARDRLAILETGR